MVETARLADRVVRRSAQAALEAVYDNELGPAGQWRRPAGAADALSADERHWIFDELITPRANRVGYLGLIVTL
ncbi:hypothetical protein [Streptomyces lydicus]|uniref:hypothetical protein n=1 Tax=Streptomyces lydicus TaxID=47763 RepID=UPI003419CD69